MTYDEAQKKATAALEDKQIAAIAAAVERECGTRPPHSAVKCSLAVSGYPAASNAIASFPVDEDGAYSNLAVNSAIKAVAHLMAWQYEDYGEWPDVEGA